MRSLKIKYWSLTKRRIITAGCLIFRRIDMDAAKSDVNKQVLRKNVENGCEIRDLHLGFEIFNS